MFQEIVSGMMTILFYLAVAVAAWKMYEISKELGEIKAILAELRRGAAPAAPAAPASGPISLESAEALLREVAAESHAAENKPTA
jgi:hypothetical protein